MKLIDSFLVLMLSTQGSFAMAQAPITSCAAVAEQAALSTNNEEPDPEITPPATRAKIQTVVKENADFVVILDTGVQYEVSTELQVSGICKAVQVDSL